MNIFKLLLFLVTLSSVLYGQERVNRPKLKFEACSDTLSKAIGWAYNETLGEWVDFENSISDDKNIKKNYSICDLCYKGQNFLKLYTKSTFYKETKYYIFIVEKCASSFNLDVKKVTGYIFNNEEYQKITNIENIVELKSCGRVTVINYANSFDENVFLDLIQSEIIKEDKEYSPHYIFPLLKSKEGMIRFCLPDFFSNYFPYNFDKAYFEVDPKSFSKIILK
jgi:hypothetical protein